MGERTQAYVICLKTWYTCHLKGICCLHFEVSGMVEWCQNMNVLMFHVCKVRYKCKTDDCGADNTCPFMYLYIHKMV